MGAELGFTCNGVRYRVPDRPVVVICIDGCADEYLDEALLRGRMPRLEAMIREGWRGIVRGAMPSFTNVNNAAIVCGAPPSVTGISGNYVLDRERGEPVMTNTADFLRCETILAAAARAGRKVAMVTAKDKLRRLLSKDLEGIAFSSEKVDTCTLAEHGVEGLFEEMGRPVPPVYSGELSLYALDAGALLLESGRSDFLYVTTSDYIQHKHAPDEEEALAFHAGIDRALGRYLDSGALVGITADHGMSGKCGPDGKPQVVFVEGLLRDAFGEGPRVVCPITDPYVVHHGALGSYVVVHCDPTLAPRIAARLLEEEGITEVLHRSRAARLLQLPEDQLGELVVMSARDHVLGRREEDHDLTQLDGRPLRSHGGRYEEMVPLVLSCRPHDGALARLRGDPRSFEIYRFLLNGEPLS